MHDPSTQLASLLQSVSLVHSGLVSFPGKVISSDTVGVGCGFLSGEVDEDCKNNTKIMAANIKAIIKGVTPNELELDACLCSLMY